MDNNKLWAWVINLDHRYDRLHQMIEKCKLYDIDMIRVPAFSEDNGDSIPEEYVVKKWNTTLNSLFDNRYSPHSIILMSAGERGCAMSHLYLWKEMYKYNIKTAFILEDDITFSVNNIGKEIEEYLSIIPPDWDILYLDYHIGMRPQQVFGISKSLYRGFYTWNTGAYIINLKGVKKILNHLPIDRPVDNFLAMLSVNGIINVYLVSPVLAIQDRTDSDIIHTIDINRSFFQNK
jgi:GR25 family glycosyltransferase involved in LPS biosynthesis